jgi:hypothetical protein
MGKTRINCPSCGETLPAGAISCRYCGHELRVPLHRGESTDARNGPKSGGNAGAAGQGSGSRAFRGEDTESLWSDEEFARVSRMGPGEPEQEPPGRRLLGVAAVAAMIVVAGALAVTFIPAGSWFGNQRVAPFPDEVMQQAAAPGAANEPERVDPAYQPRQSLEIPLVPPAPPVNLASEVHGPIPSAKPAAPAKAGERETGSRVLAPDDGAARGGGDEPTPAPLPPAQVSRATPPADEPRADAPTNKAAESAPESEPKQAPAPAPASGSTPQKPSAVDPDMVGKGNDIHAAGDLVAWLQRRLASFGFYDGPIHGRADARTRQAIREWQQALEMTPSGNIDHALVVSLRRALPERSASESP